MNSEIERPESPSFDDADSSNDLYTRPNDIAGPHYQSTCTLQSLNRLGELCWIPAEVMKDFQMPEPTESPEEHRPGFFYVYEIYFKGCCLTFPLPEALVRYLSDLEIALPQLTSNLLRTILGIITIAAEAGYAIGVPKLNELLSVRSSSKKVGYFSAYLNANRNLISHLPNKDENWHHPWLLVKKSPASIGNLLDLLPSKWNTKPAFIAPTLPTAEFGEFFKIIIEGETLWNFFTLDRFIEANHKLRLIPPGHLLQLPLPPPLPKGTSARAIASRRKTMSKSIVEACEVNKSFLQSIVDKKVYSRTLLVDDGSAERARSAGAYRPTPHREGHNGRSSHKERSPRRDSPRPTSRTGLSSEPIADLIRKKRDRPSHSSSSPKRDKTRARTDRSPRPSPPPRSMGPPPPVTVSPSSGSGDAGTKVVLVPQTKSLTAAETEGNVFRCFKTRKDTILPAFDRWRPAIRERFLLHAHNSSRANSELNDMIEYYERLLLDREKDVMAWKDKSSSPESDLRSSNDTRLKLEDQLDNLSTKIMKSNGELQEQYQRYDKIQEELSTSRDRLSESESSAYELSNQLSELQLKYIAVANYRDAELARSASKAMKEVKGRGMELIQGAIVFIQTEKARTELESDIKEYESNLLLLDQTHEDDFSEERERDELKAVLEEKQNRLAALPSSLFNPQQFEEFFTESPPLSESGLDWAAFRGTRSAYRAASVLETVITPPKIPPSTNSETVVIEDDDGSDSVVPCEQSATDEPGETETAAVDPDSVRTEPEISENSSYSRSSTSIAAYAMKGSAWVSRGKRLRPELPVSRGR
ncbi:unnamed protein product [Arabidopsis thaliana]|uniref:Myosin heavy chain-like protein n=1 Tax=Arabidopsis thaliana TaxID=3702 RepID=A0A5S9WP26_ARATH|nr:unnamed protein product [Arabidopsis thaliana]